MIRLLILQIVAGLVVLWLALLSPFLIIAWRRKSVKKTIQRLAIAHLLAGIVLLLLLFDVRPSVDTPKLTIEDKIQLRQKMGGDRDSEIREIAFTGNELGRGMRSAADLVAVDLRGMVEFPAEDTYDLQFSLGLPIFGFVNGQMVGTALIKDGQLTAAWQAVRIGRLSAPGWVRNTVFNRMESWIRRDPSVARALASVTRAKILDERVELSFLRGQNIADGFVLRWQSPDRTENFEMAIAVIRSWLAERAKSSEATAPSSSMVDAVRGLMRETLRVVPNWQPERQNRVFVLAGAFALGHRKLMHLAGQRMEPEELFQLERHGGSVRVHGRNDLVRHFWVSAGLVELASSRISHIAGITKEEMDSGKGGSGFSFADLLADRSGVRFAELATQSNAIAARLQSDLSGDWQQEDLVASIEELPEGIEQSRFESEFGGSDGPLFQQWSTEIDARVRTSQLLWPRE